MFLADLMPFSARLRRNERSSGALRNWLASSSDLRSDCSLNSESVNAPVEVSTSNISSTSSRRSSESISAIASSMAALKILLASLKSGQWMNLSRNTSHVKPS